MVPRGAGAQGTRSVRRWLPVLALLAALPATAAAQRRPQDARRIRAEYAGVLLQSKKYDEAIVEYRRLVAAEPSRFDYRLGLARALAWSKRHRDAETELARLRALRPGNAEVEQLTRTVRAALDPSSAEARSWVTGDPGHLPYRLQLARAYAREGRSRQAADQFDTIFRAGVHDELAQEAAAANADPSASRRRCRCIGERWHEHPRIPRFATTTRARSGQRATGMHRSRSTIR